MVIEGIITAANLISSLLGLTTAIIAYRLASKNQRGK